jgi:DNA polymerase-3 subunit delta'
VLALRPLDAEAFASALRAAQEAAGHDMQAGEAVAKLHAVYGGSVGRALALSADRGLDLVDRVAAILAALPSIDWPGAHALADDLGGASDARYAIFHEVLLDGIGQIVRAAATGEGRPEHKAAAGRLIGKGRLASWAGLWETMLRDNAEGLALNLDRKALLLDTFLRIEAVTRGEPGAGAGPA